MQNGAPKRKHTRLALLVSAAMLAAALPVYADNQQKIEDSRQKIEENKEELSRIEGEKAQLEEKLQELSALKSDAAAYISKLDRELSDLGDQITDLSNQMTAKNAEIETTQAELAAAQAQEAEQYASMKLRIKYMYEEGNTNFLDLLLEAESLSDMLNRAEYIQKVSEYDRRKLEEFVQIREQIAATELRLEQEYAELDLMKQETEAKQDSVEALQADKQKD